MNHMFSRNANRLARCRPYHKVNEARLMYIGCNSPEEPLGFASGKDIYCNMIDQDNQLGAKLASACVTVPITTREQKLTQNTQ